MYIGVVLNKMSKYLPWLLNIHVSKKFVLSALSMVTRWACSLAHAASAAACVICWLCRKEIHRLDL